MILAMAGFAMEDLFIKLLSERLSVAQILLMSGLLGAPLFYMLLKSQGHRFWTAELLDRRVLIRTISEMLGGVLFVTALATGELSMVAVILQASPLLMVIGAAVFLGENVGWRRWVAVAVGFCGMLLVVRPGTATFDASVIWAILSIIMLAARDLSTRLVDPRIPSLQLSTAAFAIYIPTGLLLLLITPAQAVSPTDTEMMQLVACVAFGMLAYSAIVGATRIGEVSAIVPFRYSRLLFALLIAGIVLGERPDALTLLGAAILIASGLYTLYREARLRAKQAKATPH